MMFVSAKRQLIYYSKKGNGMTDAFKMIPSYYDMACTPASVNPFVDISSCVGMKQIVKSRMIYFYFLSFVYVNINSCV